MPSALAPGPRRPGRWARAIRHGRLRTRITALVAIPLIAVIFYGLSDVGRLIDERDKARATADRAARVEPISRLSFQLRLEQSVSQSIVNLHARGLSADAVRQVLGIDLPAMLKGVRSDVNASVDSVTLGPLGMPGEAGALVAQAISLRTAIDRNMTSIDSIAEDFGEASQALDTVARDDLAFVRSSLAYLPNAASLGATLESANLLVADLYAHSAEMMAISRYLLPGMREDDDLVTFAAAATRRIELTDEIERALTPSARPGWQALRNSPEWRRMSELEVQLLISLGLVQGSRSEVAPLAVEFISGASAISDSISTFLRDEAARLARESRAAGSALDGDVSLAAARAAAVIVITTAFALFTLRSLVRPLHAVEQHALAVSRGNLDTPPIPNAGPYEIAIVADAMNELGTNLRRLVAQTNALATGEIESASLNQLPSGPVGQSVQLAVQRLSSATSELRVNARQANAIVEQAGDAIFTVDVAGIVKRVNAAATRLFGYPTDWLLNTPVRHYLRYPLDNGENAVYRSDQTDIPVELTITPVPNSDLLTVYARDLSSVKQREQLLTYQAQHDSLTSLLNRAALSERLTSLFARDTDWTLFFLDLDGFKIVNDTYGHQAGDDLLRAVGSRLKAALRSSDVGARFGGDEFVAVIHNLRGMADAVAFGKRLIEIIEEPFQIPAGVIRISVSIGVARPRGGESIEELLRRADGATYSAKRAGRGCVRVSDPERLAQRTAAARAIENLSEKTA